MKNKQLEEKIKYFLLAIVQAIVFLFFIIILTSKANEKELSFRLSIGIVLLISGFLIIKFKDIIGKHMFNGQMKFIKKRTTMPKMTSEVKHFGLVMFIIGIGSIVLALLL